MSDLMVLVTFTQNSGDDPAIGLALADVDLYLTAVNRATGARTVIWDGTQNPTFEVNNTGTYGRIYNSADLDTYHYVGAGQYTGAAVLDNDWAVGTAANVSIDVSTLINSVIAGIFSVSPARDALVKIDLCLYRGDTWLQPISRLGNLTGYERIWITAKADKDDADSAASFQVLLSDPPQATDGLQIINGAVATTPGNAEITIVDLGQGQIMVRIEAEETAKLEGNDKLYYDVQWDDGSDIESPLRGRLSVVSDVTRAV